MRILCTRKRVRLYYIALRGGPFSSSHRRLENGEIPQDDRRVDGG